MTEDSEAADSPGGPLADNLVEFEGIGYRDLAFNVLLPLEQPAHWFAKRLVPGARVQLVIWVMRGIDEEIQ